MTLTIDQQRARFGMTTQEAHAIRDKAAASLNDLTAARAAWQALAYELRGNKGQPFQCPQHPEAVRIHMLAALADGATIDAAVNAARAFAFTASES